MRKTLNINLGGMAFIIDENAFELLYNYLETLKRKFKNEAERDEIINDIEARLAELLTQKMGNRKEVLSLEEVSYVIGLMGKPEDIAGDEPGTEAEGTTTTATDANTSTNSQYQAPQAQARIQKRLFRDPDDAKVSGVISGLCHYFGINDPVWLRIAAVILIPLTSGSIILVYFLMAIVVPKALTSAEKLQMKGEPINISTIEKEVKDAAGRFGSSVKNTFESDDFFNKAGSYGSSAARSIVRVVFAVIGLFATAALIGVFGSFLTFAVFGTSWFNNLTNFLVDGPSSIWWFSFGFLFFFGTPLVALIYVCIRGAIGSTIRVRWLKWVLLALWISSWAMLAISISKVSMAFKDSATIKDVYVLQQPADSTLFVQIADSTATGWEYVEDEDGERTDWEALIGNNDISELKSLRIDEPELQLMPSDNDSFYIQRIVTSRGANRQDAIKNAKTVTYAFAQTGSTINLSQYFELPKGNGKFRAQSVKIRLAIPKGKLVKFGNNIDEWAAIVKNDNSYDRTLFANTTWTTTEQGKVKCITCEEKVVNSDDEGADEEVVTENISEQNGDTLKHTVTIKKKKTKKDEYKDEDF